MQKSRLVQLLKYLNKKELREFEDFVTSPFYNKDERVIQLLRLLYKYAPNYTHSKLAKEAVFKTLFPKKTRMTSYFRVLLSTLTRLLEEFIITQKFNEAPLYKKHLLLKSLLKRGAKHHFGWIYPTIKNSSNEVKKKGISDYLELYHLDLDNYNHIHSYEKKVFQSPATITYSLDIYYILNKLKFACAALSNQQVAANDYNPELEQKKIKTLVKLMDCQDIPLVKAYYMNFLILIDESNEDSFRNLQQVLNNNADDIPSEELNDFFIMSINYCIGKVIEGKSNYLHDLFAIYKQLVQHGLLLKDKYVSPAHFKNIVSLGAKLKEFDWTEQFIYDYKKHIEPKIRTSVYHFNLGTLFLYKKDYDKAQSNLMLVQGPNIFYEINYRFLLLKTYYQLNDILLLLPLAEAFKAFLRNNKQVNDSHQEAYINFTNILVNLIKCKNEEGRWSIEQIEEKLNKFELISDKKWLNERIEEIKKK